MGGGAPAGSSETIAFLGAMPLTAEPVTGAGAVAAAGDGVELHAAAMTIAAQAQAYAAASFDDSVIQEVFTGQPIRSRISLHYL